MRASLSLGLLTVTRHCNVKDHGTLENKVNILSLWEIDVNTLLASQIYSHSQTLMLSPPKTQKGKLSVTLLA